jgi:hypothetical protein
MEFFNFSTVDKSLAEKFLAELLKYFQWSCNQNIFFVFYTPILFSKNCWAFLPVFEFEAKCSQTGLTFSFKFICIKIKLGIHFFTTETYFYTVKGFWEAADKLVDL